MFTYSRLMRKKWDVFFAPKLPILPVSPVAVTNRHSTLAPWNPGFHLMPYVGNDHIFAQNHVNTYLLGESMTPLFALLAMVKKMPYFMLIQGLPTY